MVSNLRQISTKDLQNELKQCYERAKELAAEILQRHDNLKEYKRESE